MNRIQKLVVVVVVVLVVVSTVGTAPVLGTAEDTSSMATDGDQGPPESPGNSGGDDDDDDGGQGPPETPGNSGGDDDDDGDQGPPETPGNSGGDDDDDDANDDDDDGGQGPPETPGNSGGDDDDDDDSCQGLPESPGNSGGDDDDDGDQGPPESPGNSGGDDDDANDDDDDSGQGPPEHVFEDNQTGPPEHVLEDNQTGPPEHVLEDNQTGPPEHVFEDNQTGPPEHVFEDNQTGPPEHVLEDNQTGPPEHVFEDNQTELRDRLNIESDSRDATEPSILEYDESGLERDEERGTSSATFRNTTAVRAVTFESAVEGQVETAELDREPASIGQPDGETVSVNKIQVPEDAINESATIRLTIDADAVDEDISNQSSLVVNRFNSHVAEWQELQTTIVEADDDEIVLEAATPGFSIFVVSTVSEPTANIEMKGTVALGESITFDGSQSVDRHGDIEAYYWEINGTEYQGETVTETFTESGSYRVVLTVVNDAGKTDTATFTLTVGDDGVGDHAEPTVGGITQGPGVLLVAHIGFVASGSVIALLGMIPLFRRLTVD